MTNSNSTASTNSPIGRGTYHLFLGNLSFTFAGAITSIVIGRILAPDRFGLYAIALIVPTYVYLALQFGLPSTATRFSAKYLSEGDEKRAISFSYAILAVHLGVGLLAFALLIPFTSEISIYVLHRPELSNGLVIPVALLSIVGLILFNDGSGAFLGLHRFRETASFQVVNGFSKLAISVLLVVLGFSVFGAVVGYTLGFLVSGTISLIMLVVMNGSLVPRNVRESVATSFGYAPPIYFSSIVFGIIAPFQSTILAYQVSNTEIGWYTAAASIATLISLFTYPISNAVFPLFSKTMEGGTKQLALAFKLSVKYAALLVIPLTMFVMAFAAPLSIAIYGRAYASAGNYLLLYAVVNLLAGAGSLSDGPFLYGVGETRKAFVATAVGSATSIGASLLLVFYLGVYGIIVGTILGQGISLYISLRYISDILGAKPSAWFFGRVYVASALSAVIIYPISSFIPNPYLSVPLGALIFLLVLIPIMTVMKALTEDDLDGLRAQLRDVRVMSSLLRLISRYQRFLLRRK